MWLEQSDEGKVEGNEMNKEIGGCGGGVWEGRALIGPFQWDACQVKGRGFL